MCYEEGLGFYTSAGDADGACAPECRWALENEVGLQLRLKNNHTFFALAEMSGDGTL